jgi:hypothetical protein
MIEIKELRNHDCKHYIHPTDPTKRICRQSSGLVHALTDKGWEDIETELPDYNFPEATPFKKKEDKHFIMDLPSWGTPVLEDDGKTLKVLDKSGKSIYRYRDLTALPKGDKPYVVATKNLEMKLVDNLNNLEDGDIVGKNKNAIDGQFHAENGKMYVKFDESVQYPIDVFDSTDTSSTNGGDSFVSSYTGETNTNYGSSDYLAIGQYGDVQKLRAFVKFTLSSTPVGGPYTISDVVLKLKETQGRSGIVINVHALSRTNWTEAGVTWNKYDGTNNWTTPGGDYSATIIDQITNTASNFNSFALMGSGADNPLTLTWGDVVHLCLKGNVETNPATNTNFYSKEYATSGDRPVLEITYSAASTTNASLLLLMV